MRCMQTDSTAKYVCAHILGEWQTSYWQLRCRQTCCRGFLKLVHKLPAPFS